MSHEILQPPYVVRQGASNEGREPEAAEIPLAGAVFSLREAVYAFPNGSTRNEYGEWVDKMRLITVKFYTVLYLAIGTHLSLFRVG